MAGILQRFKDIMSSNINALLDKAEDPEKMIDQYLRNLQNDLGKVKAETASVMAEETRAKRQLDECQSEINKMQSYAEKAVVAGNDDDAKQFLTKKQELNKNLEVYQLAYNQAKANADRMRQMHDKLESDIATLNSRREAIKVKVKMAKTQETMNKLGSSVKGAQGSLDAFSRMEAKADRMLDEANAMSELNAPKVDTVDNLASKYDAESTAPAVEDELAALKAQLGK